MTVIAANRRPTGEPQRLPRPIYPSGLVYLVLTAIVLGAWLSAVRIDGAADVLARLDRDVADVFRPLRRGVIEDAARTAGHLGDEVVWRALRWTTIALLLWHRRVRHLAVYLILLLAVGAVVARTADWTVPAPSTPVVALGVGLVGAMYTLLPRGRRRNRAKVLAGSVLAMLVMARVGLGLDEASDAILSVTLGVALPVVAFRWLTPHAVFPIEARNQHALLLAQRQRIERAVLADHGWQVVDIVPLRPPGSSGSTPLRLTVRQPGEQPVEVFAKLYSLTNLRADRWYKAARAVLYGRLEDEAPFVEVRQLVEHEDYLLRLASNVGLPVPTTFGISELASGREYLLLTEMLPDARQLSEVAITDELIDAGLAVVRTLWDTGLAHRDIKPANLVVTHDRMFLVDLSFGEVRPSAWRKSVDLGNMLLCLALDAGAERVYRRATRQFTPDEIGEALACMGSVTIPAQLRSMLRGRPLLHELADLAPAHPLVGQQRWTWRRMVIGTAALTSGIVTVALVALNLDNAGLL